MIKLRLRHLKGKNSISQASFLCKLAKYHAKKLIVTTKLFDFLVSIVSFDASIELIVIDQTHQLSKNGLRDWHSFPLLGSLSNSLQKISLKG
jgi:hypothetical protein